jgi:chitin disaccharide deacetylase
MSNGQPSSAAARDNSLACDAPGRSNAAVIINADDWGRDVLTTDRTLECVLGGSVSSVSAMVFMADSERAAGLARLHGVDAGLHLNFTLPFTATACPPQLLEHQRKLARFAKSYWRAATIYHPGLASSFEYVVKAQMEEYQRLFGTTPGRIDGHHHMHLSANVMAQRLLPGGIIVRRNFSFGSGEKGYLNRLFRLRQDGKLSRRHRIADFFFDLIPFEPTTRLEKILALADRYDIEIETHPVRDEEYRFLMGGGVERCMQGGAISRGYLLRFGNIRSNAGRVSCAQRAWR